MVRFGVPGQNDNPLAYVDKRLSLVPAIDSPRRPTVNDKKFPMWCEWRVNKKASLPAEEGEFYKLVKFESNGDATWVAVSSSGGTAGVEDIRDQVGVGATPSLTGDIDIHGNVVANAANPSGIPLETVADPGNNTIDVNIQVAAERNGAPGDSNDAGLASFSDSGFDVDVNGYVTLLPTVTTSYDTDSGTATPALNVLKVLGAGGVSTSGAGDTLTITAGSNTPTSFPTDSGTAIPAANLLNLLGGDGINTAGSGDTATVALNIPVIEIHGGTGQTSYVQGDILYADGANSLVKLPSGSNGQVLTLVAGIPSWEASSGGGGGWTFLASVTASASASIEFTSLIDSTFYAYAFVIQGLLPSTDGVIFRLRTSTDGGSSYSSGASDYSYNTSASNDQTASSIEIVTLVANGQGNGTNETLDGIVYAINPSDATVRKNFLLNIGYANQSDDFQRSIGAGVRKSTADIDAVQFTYGSGNIASGTIKMYGVCQPS